MITRRVLLSSLLASPVVIAAHKLDYVPRKIAIPMKLVASPGQQFHRVMSHWWGRQYTVDSERNIVFISFKRVQLGDGL